VIVAIDPEKNRDDLPLPETIEAQIVVEKDAADGRLRAKMGRMGYGERKWISARSLDNVYPGPYTGTLTRQKALNVAANAVGVPANETADKPAITSQNMKSLMSPKLAAWTLVSDPDTGGTGWVWNAEDSQSLTQNPAIWTIPQLASAPEGNFFPLGSAVIAALKDGGTVGDESDRKLIENFVVRVARGSISHWGRQEAKSIYQFMSGKVFYKPEDEQANRIPRGSKVGDFKVEYVKAGLFDFEKALREYNDTNQNDYAKRLREKQAAVAANIGWQIDQNATLADGANQVLSVFNQLANPFMWCAMIGGGEGVVLPQRGTGTWSAVAWEGGFLLANFVPIGALASKGKVFFRFAATEGSLPAARQGARALVPDEAIVRSAGQICFVAGTQVRTMSGYRAIESIAPGDLVWSRDDQSGQSGWKPVVRTFVTHPGSLVKLKYSYSAGSGTLTGTPQHPFWVEDRRAWVPMGKLCAGYRLCLDNGQMAEVVSLTRGPHGDYTTYNFEVMDWHTYFVAPANATEATDAVWVHNMGELCDEGLAKAREIYARKGERMFDRIDVPDWQKALIREANPVTAPGGGLRAHELAGGHTLVKHVKKTDQELLARLASEPRISASSSFFSKEIADFAANKALSDPAQAQRVATWLAGAGQSLSVRFRFLFSVGRSIPRGQTAAQDAKGVLMWLERDASMPGGYRLNTFFPEL
jgi:hypothetical protein